jgi:alcohol dehydrogenase
MIKISFPLPQFFNAANIISGENALLALKGLQASKVVVIASKSVLKKHQERLINLINVHDIKVIEKDWPSEPSIENIKPALKETAKFNPDCILAVGGGSVIDSAKAIWAYYEHPYITDEQLYRPFAIPSLRGKSRFIAIPTTIGSGSEVSSSAIFFDQVTGKKKAIVTHDFLPDVVILAPELVVDIPVKIMVSSAMDALSHAIEGLVSTIQHKMMDQFALSAIQTIFRLLPKAVKNPNLEVIEELQFAATYAGWVQNHCLVGAAHVSTHLLANNGVSHGEGNALFLPSSVKLNAKYSEAAAAKYQMLSEICGLTSTEALIDKLVDLRALGGLSSSLADYHLDPSVLTTEALSIMQNDPAGRCNPTELNDDFLHELFEEVR